MSFIPLRIKIILFGIVALIGVIALALTGKQTVESVLQLSRLDMVNTLVQHHMESDMMHDAIDNDVMKAINAVHKKDAETLASTKNDLAEHIATLQENQKAINELALPADVRELVAPLAQQFEGYDAAANQIIALAENDIKADTLAANDAHPAFQARFKEVEKAMSDASDYIASWSERIKTQGLESAAKGKEILWYITLASVLIALSMPIYMYLSLFRPQRKLLKLADDVLHNKFDAEIPYTKRRDEIGALAKILAAMKKAGEDKMRIASQFEAKVKSIVDIVASAATEMGASAAGVATNITDNINKLSDLNQNMQRTSSNIQAVASAVGQLSASSSEIRVQVAQSGKINTTAVEQSQEVNHISQELATSVQTVGEITTVISTITNQINLLSLNATIEAARAGEAGKGFAVVASEVKTLANQTAKSTGDISAQIGIIQETATKALGGMKNISDVIQQIDHVSTTIASAIEEQGQATESISRNIEEAARYSNNIAEHVASVSKMAERTGSEAEEMKKASSDLARHAENLRREVDSFLVSIRSDAA